MKIIIKINELHPTGYDIIAGVQFSMAIGVAIVKRPYPWPIWGWKYFGPCGNQRQFRILWFIVAVRGFSE